MRRRYRDLLVDILALDGNRLPNLVDSEMCLQDLDAHLAAMGFLGTQRHCDEGRSLPKYGQSCMLPGSGSR